MAKVYIVKGAWRALLHATLSVTIFSLTCNSYARVISDNHDHPNGDHTTPARCTKARIDFLVSRSCYYKRHILNHSGMRGPTRHYTVHWEGLPMTTYEEDALLWQILGPKKEEKPKVSSASASKPLWSILIASPSFYREDRHKLDTSTPFPPGAVSKSIWPTLIARIVDNAASEGHHVKSENPASHAAAYASAGQKSHTEKGSTLHRLDRSKRQTRNRVDDALVAKCCLGLCKKEDFWPYCPDI